MNLLFLNALKGLKRKKVQMTILILLITLSTGIYVAMNSALDRLENRYYSYLDEQNVENVSLDVNIDITKEISKNDFKEIKEKYLNNVTEDEKNIIKSYEFYLNTSYVYDSNMFTAVSYILNKYDAINYLEEQKLDSIKEKYYFDYEKQYSKLITEDKISMKILPYIKDKKINKPFLLEGRYPENEKEITILKGFAKKNNIKLNDEYKIGEENYKVVGFAYASDYIYPLITMSVPIFDEAKNNVIIMNKEDYDKIGGITDNTYAIRYTNDVKRKFKFEMTNNEEGTTLSIKDDPTTALLENEQDKVHAGVNTVLRIARIGGLQLEFASNRLFAKYFLYLLLTISVIIISIITKKRIEDEKLQIGVLKSLGYSKYTIALSYLCYPIIGSIIGGTLGFLIGSGLNTLIAKLYTGYFNVPIEGNIIYISYLKDSILIPLILLSILCYLIAIIMLRKKPLKLLKEGSNLKVNLFSKLVNLLTKLLPFKQRFKYSLASRSIGKLLIVTVTSFGAGMLIVLTLMGINLFKSAIDESFNGMNYDYIVYMNNYYPNNNTDDTYLLQTDAKLKKANNEELDEDITLSGIDNDASNITLLNDENKDLKQLLKENEVIVSVNMKEKYNLKENDEVIVNLNDKNITYKVVGFNNDYFSYTIYQERNYLSKELGFNDKVYNIIYSKDKKYSNLSTLSEDESSKINYVMSLTDLKDNLLTQMDRYNTTIYIIIIFASIMAFAIILVISNIVVEENKKTISLMKVMGYTEKETSNIVLNIYTPFVIVAYLLSIPAMTNLLKWIVSQLVEDTNVTIPITLPLKEAMIGLIGLLVAYYVALTIAKKSLNKIPLAIALKRE